MYNFQIRTSDDRYFFGGRCSWSLGELVGLKGFVEGFIIISASENLPYRTLVSVLFISNMFGTKRFGRNLSNVQPGGQALAAKQPPLKRARTANTVASVTVVKQAVIPTRVQRPAAQAAPSLFRTVAPSLPTPVSSFHFEEDDSLSDVDKVDRMSLDIVEIEHENIDRFDTHDPQFASEYIDDIMAFLKKKEITMQIPHDYCSRQTDITPRHRNQLTRWMAEVYIQLRLLPETYFLGINILDQVLAGSLVSRKKLHLIGVASIFIAAKYEETWAPPLFDLGVCCDNAFSEAEILRMEREILNRIDFNLAIAAPLHFLRRFSKAGYSDGTTHTIAKFLTEMTCQSYAMLKFLPSQIAAAAVLLARQIHGGFPELWDNNLRFYSGYEVSDLIECGQALSLSIIKEVRSTRGPCAIVRKYSDRKLLGVATTVVRALTQNR